MSLTDQELEAIHWTEQLLDSAKLQIRLPEHLSLRDCELIYLGASVQENSHNTQKMAELGAQFTKMTHIPHSWGSPSWTIGVLARALEGLRNERNEAMREFNKKNPPIDPPGIEVVVLP